MRSFPVRPALFLAAALLLTALFLRPESTDAPPLNPLPATSRLPAQEPIDFRKSILSPPPFLTEDMSPRAATIAILRSRIARIDRDSNGSFLETLDAVLSDPAQSVAVANYRLPAGGGNASMLETFATEAASVTEEHDRLLLIVVASAFRGCASDDDYIRRFDELTVRYPWLVAYVSQQ